MTIFFKNSRLVCIVIVSIFIFKNAFSQITGDPHEDFLEGEFYVSQGMYTDALPYYLSVVRKDTGNCNVNYRIGLCYMKQQGEESKALPYLLRAIREINPKYVEGKYKSSGAPPETYILLGDDYFRENDLANALDAYSKYRDLIGTSDKKKSDVINKRIDAVDKSKELQLKSQNLVLINLGDQINSKYSENNPVLSGDQKTLIYTQSREAFEKIFVSHNINGVWSKPVDITRQIGSEGDCYSTGISNDGTELYVIKHDDQNSDIYVAKLVKNRWQRMEPVPGKINTRYHESSACVSPDGNKLYFSSDRPKGFGGYDIYVAEKTKDVWGNVKNLGNVINTDKDEINPYISADGKILYFSSNGHESVGNMDILYSEMGADGNWKAPVNPGTPINTTGDDLSYIYFDDSKTGYISRKLADGYGQNDIYSIGPPAEKPVPQEVVTQTTEAPVTSNLVVTDTLNSGSATAVKEKNLNQEVPVSTSSSSSQMASSVSYNQPENSKTSLQHEAKKTKTTKSSNVKPVKEKKISKNLVANVAISFTRDTGANYTIQIFALIHPCNAGNIKLKPIVISKGNDNYYRYTYGQYKSIIEAQASLKRLESMGFNEAFIKKISAISNYSKSE